jgi:hypothetical protein
VCQVAAAAAAVTSPALSAKRTHSLRIVFDMSLAPFAVQPTASGW